MGFNLPSAAGRFFAFYPPFYQQNKKVRPGEFSLGEGVETMCDQLEGASCGSSVVFVTRARAKTNQTYLKFSDEFCITKLEKR